MQNPIQICAYFLHNLFFKSLGSHYLVSYFPVFHLHFSHFFHLLIFIFLLHNRKKFFMTYSMSIIACDTKVSMLFSLLLANIRILQCFFFLLLVMLSNFFIIPLVKEKIKVKIALLFQQVFQQHS